MAQTTQINYKELGIDFKIFRLQKSLSTYRVEKETKIVRSTILKFEKGNPIKPVCLFDLLDFAEINIKNYITVTRT